MMRRNDDLPKPKASPPLLNATSAPMSHRRCDHFRRHGGRQCFPKCNILSHATSSYLALPTYVVQITPKPEILRNCHGAYSFLINKGSTLRTTSILVTVEMML